MKLCPVDHHECIFCKHEGCFLMDPVDDRQEDDLERAERMQYREEAMRERDELFPEPDPQTGWN